MDSYDEELLYNIKSLFGKKDFSDCVIEIIETENFMPTLKGSRFLRKRHSTVERELGNEILYCTLPVHCNILCMQWEYFKLLLECAPKQPNKVVQLKVGMGEGSYLKSFIEAIYNNNIFFMMGIRKFLCVMEMADRYSCETVIRGAAYAIPYLHISEASECDYVSQRIDSTNYSLAAMDIIADALMKRCGELLSNKFYPLEENIEKYEKEYLDLSFESLLGVLKCQKPFCNDENSVLYFIIFWLEKNEYFPSPENIKSILEEINPQKISAYFLVDIVTEKHPVLSKFDGFKDWFIKVIANSYLSEPRHYKIDVSQANRNSSKEEKVLRFVLPFTKLNPTTHQSNKTFIFKGYVLRPMLISEELGVSDERKYIGKEILIECLNYNGNFCLLEEKGYVSLFSFKAAFTIRHGDQSRDDIFPSFQNINDKELFSCVCDVTIPHNRKPRNDFFFGYGDEDPFKNVDEFDLYLAVTDKDASWPSSFPKQLK